MLLGIIASTILPPVAQLRKGRTATDLVRSICARASIPPGLLRAIRSPDAPLCVVTIFSGVEKTSKGAPGSGLSTIVHDGLDVVGMPRREVIDRTALPKLNR
ncbi:hypothetical protein LQG66_10230 [Bradyrhizobium ontarionense]|uniref:Uncharacterized protein n=1 Tax=Bradyrhizobium ontarionense TaxID=2898149 RepID=A0ABY3RGN6_9BRAD|nr:hypothetical protein [Bradyrhizobium sp. A19]UFZ06640.1 hypothetical protein LQG66_10230 [Bradyrhizobium sp. A19]